MDEDQEKAARDRLEKDKQMRAEQEAAAEARNAWRPTPTQEEADLVAMGVPVDQVGHKDDGSGPDPHARAWPGKKPDDERTRDMRPGERKPGDGYETR